MRSGALVFDLESLTWQPAVPMKLEPDLSLEFAKPHPTHGEALLWSGWKWYPRETVDPATPGVAAALMSG